MNVALLTIVTGFFLGVRHCLEPDHLTALAQFASASKAPRDGLRAGLLWGLGHGVSVLVLGVAFSAFWSRLPHVEVHAERAVGLTLIVLSLWRLRDRRRERHAHEHRHAGGLVHSHEHRHDSHHAHVHAPTLTGLVHGAAGALGVVLLLSLSSPGSLVAAAIAFSVGALLAMGLAGWLAARFYASMSLHGWGHVATSLTSAWGITLGVFWLLTA